LHASGVLIAGCISILFIAAAGVAASLAMLPEVIVSSEIAVAAPKVYVTDLLTPESLKALGADNRLESTVVTLSPLPGKSKLLDGRAVRDRLSEIGITPNRYSIRTPDQIRIERLSQTFLPRDIEELVRRDFLPTLPWEEIQLAELGIPESVVLPRGKVDLSFQQPPRTNLARPFYLNVDFRVDGQLVKRSYFRTALTILDTVPIADRELTPAFQITPEDIRWEKRPLRSTLQPPVRDLSFFEGRKPRTTIAAGTSLTEDLFVTVPLIKRGDTVMVIFEGNAIRLSVPGQSLTSGSKGDRIRVINKDSRAELLGEVIDAKTVRIVN
jgi:flagella basal body P-ring formation protein FlgA